MVHLKILDRGFAEPDYLLYRAVSVLHSFAFVHVHDAVVSCVPDDLLGDSVRDDITRNLRSDIERSRSLL